MTKVQKNRLGKIAEQLNMLILEVRETHPDAQYYVEDGTNLYVLDGPSHDDTHGNPARQDRQLHLVRLIYSDCGAW